MAAVLEFDPGEAAQVDFGKGPEVLDPRTGELLSTWIFVMTLAWSRHAYAEVVTDQKVATWLGCHRRAFEWFNGVPRRLTIDNPKCAITRACYHDPEVQRAYAECAEGYGFKIEPCPVRDPKKKGRVESSVKYVKRSFVPLREFRDLVDANAQLRAWLLGPAGNRVHGTTHERPLTRFVETESEFLRPLPSRPPELAVWARVKLHPDCHAQFEKAYYSASFRLVRQRLWLRATETTVQLFRDHELVATHPRRFRPGSRSTIDEHLPPEALAYKLRDPQWCLRQSQDIGAACHALVERLFAHHVLDNLRPRQPAPNCADALNPHTPGTRPTTGGLAAYNGRASERLRRCRAPSRRVHRAPRESSWLLPDRQQGRPTEGRDSFRERRRSRIRQKPSGHVRTARSCAGGHVRGRVESCLRERNGCPAH